VAHRSLAGSGGGFEPAAFEQLVNLEPQSWWFRSRNRLIEHTIRAYFPAPSRILEIGCGTGFTLRALADAAPGAELTATELFDEGLAVARRRMPQVRLLNVDARDMPFHAEFDLVAAFDVLEHIDDDLKALRETFRVLVPGGGLIVTVPQHPWLWSATDEYARHERRYRRRELVERLTLAGFEIDRITSFVTALLPVMLASRLSRRSEQADPQAEFRIPRTLDRFFDAVASAEQRVIGLGISLPVGGSLLVVARKPRQPVDSRRLTESQLGS
jgi:SAM-dependent methyltransferase